MWWLSCQKAISANDVTTVSVKGNNYRIYFWYMSKVKAINLLNNANLKKVYLCKKHTNYQEQLEYVS